MGKPLSRVVRHHWPVEESTPPSRTSEAVRCTRCKLLRRAVQAGVSYGKGPLRYYWAYGDGPTEKLARSPGPCRPAAAQHAEVAHAA